MSERDYGLLEACGLSVAQTAELFRRSRQAIYTGMAHSRDYFSADNVMAILHDAKRRDSSRLEELIKFIAANYTESEGNLILLDQVASEQMGRVSREADHVMIVFNGNTDHLAPSAQFVAALIDVFSKSNERTTTVVLPGDWAVGCIKQQLEVDVPSFITRDDITYLPSFFMAKKQGTIRAFVFLRLSVEEMCPSEAVRLWKHFDSTHSESGDRELREAG